MKEICVELQGEEAMIEYGAYLAKSLSHTHTIYLQGNLGMGKTTLVRGFLQGHGYYGAVKSPTYTLVEPYELPEGQLYHFDLYRLGDPEELEYMGIRDYFDQDSISLIEWPDKGQGYLPAADIIIRIEMIPNGRRVMITANNEQAETTISLLM
ncbi:tRNA (adenosine(37)-N6)-threonylcarbamoyltransferase complex ATPase subunit type 1 TsaE [Marinomonas agarivorans]|nr:tRNA (adenosine(37)-N6)-threonylcarbamoyltransferase complex ATPase subunit type 1 TsaE [Marinomonas agarivorans]